eukprot:9318989-Alexandrium_andersonii.AAC.1
MPVWPPAASQQFQSVVFNFLALQTALGSFFHSQGVFLFHTTIKSHYLIHLGDCTAWINPRIAWNYAGEDFMQR